MWRLGLVLAAAILGTAHPSVALDWFKECTDWPSRVPSAVPDPAKDHVFVAMGKCETVLAIDTESVRIVAAQRAGDGAHGIAVASPAAVFVANIKDDTLSVLDVSSGRPAGTASTGDYPLDVVLGHGGAVYVSTWKDDTVAVVEVASQAVTGRIKADGEPQHMALARDGRTVYVTMPHEGRVDVLDAMDLEWRAQIETGPSPQQIAPRYADR